MRVLGYESHKEPSLLGNRGVLRRLSMHMVDGDVGEGSVGFS